MRSLQVLLLAALCLHGYGFQFRFAVRPIVGYGGNLLKVPTKRPSVQNFILHSRTEDTADIDNAFITRLKALDIPNKLTVSRMLAIPLFCGAFQLGLQPLVVSLYAAASVTDFLDGYLARKWNQTTPFGSFLDPVADKLMVIAALVLLTSRFPTMLYVFPVTLLACREVGVSALREFMASKGKRNTVKVGAAGKLKTLFQMVATVLLLTVTPENTGMYDICQKFGWHKAGVFASGISMLYVSTVLSLYSGCQYLHAAWPTLTGKDSADTTSGVVKGYTG